MSFSRAQLRKLPILAEIHELLKRENEAGSITRQEAVSMVPPLFLGVEPHHRVCAAAAHALQQHTFLCCTCVYIAANLVPVERVIMHQQNLSIVIIKQLIPKTSCQFLTCMQRQALLAVHPTQARLYTVCRFWTCVLHLGPRLHRLLRCYMLGLLHPQVIWHLEGSTS